MNTMTTTPAARYDVRAITVDMTGVHYGRTTTHGVRVVGSARSGHVLVADSDGDVFEVLRAQLFRSA